MLLVPLNFEFPKEVWCKTKHRNVQNKSTYFQQQLDLQFQVNIICLRFHIYQSNLSLAFYNSPFHFWEDTKNRVA